MLRFSGTGVSDVGLVRTTNEDSAFVAPYVALVADGVGGAAAGEIASATTAYIVSAMALSRFGDVLETVVSDAVASSRLSLRQGVRDDLTRSGMATTLSMVITDGRRIVMGHLGDSRVYRQRDRRLRQLSRDHTAVQQLLDAHRLDPADVGRHPWRNVLLRSVDSSLGTDPADVELMELDVRAGDRLLLCSDGISDLLPTSRIEDVLGLRDPHSAAAVLVHSALEAGGRDNVTCLVMDVIDGPQVVGDGHLLGAVQDVANVLDPASVRRA